MATQAANNTSIDSSSNKRKGPASSGMIDPKALMQIKNLEMRARVVVEGFYHGLHRSPFHGFSSEFTEYRSYVSGDDTRFLDWKLYARTDRYYVKKFEDETNLRCYLLSDHSRSMGYGSGSYSKAEYAQTLSATLAYFLFKQGDAVGLLSFDDDFREYIPARNRPGHLRQLMHGLERPVSGRNTDVIAPLKQSLQLLRKRSLVILISDLLAPIEDLEAHFGYLAASGHDMVVFHLYDPVEMTLDLEGAGLFVDLETGRDFHVDPEIARESYLEKFNAHNEKISDACRNTGIGYTLLCSDYPLEVALSEFLQERQSKGRRIMRSTCNPGRNHS